MTEEKIDVYRLDTQQTKAFNINAMSLNKSTGTSVGTFTDNRAESLKTLDASNYSATLLLKQRLATPS